MSRRNRLLVMAAAVGATFAVTATGSVAAPGDVDSFGGNIFREQLSGYNETLLAVSTPANGTFRVLINERAGEIRWALTYAENPTPVTQAHVHFGSAAQSGGISFFLCANPPIAPPVPTQACPAAPASITGTITAADVIGPAAQGIGVGEFTEIVNAMRAGFTYVNVHTAERPAGEIRAQLDHHH
ncbi:MAG TPA: CHRD domain-containing protein [Actinophytocola sp.]|uniref:CHRD domain-containing protein n=1 Tax=Actinophytocola sp. TaxID=1872138 RepID=UPI002DB5B31C|nr:CHRD domain-containing protein [Actinophytocola sp.]HEU5471423.1 CHRD domain-containing protein [Actinophytocola sp.]